MISEKLLSILACPVCKGKIEAIADNKLLCLPCGLKFDVRDDIPVMLTEEAERIF